MSSIQNRSPYSGQSNLNRVKNDPSETVKESGAKEIETGAGYSDLDQLVSNLSESGINQKTIQFFKNESDFSLEKAPTTLAQSIDSNIRKARSRIPERIKSNIVEKVNNLEKIIASDGGLKLSDSKQAMGELLSIARYLSSYGLMDSNINLELDNLAIELLKKVGDSVDLDLKMSSHKGMILGIIANPKSSNSMNSEQLELYNLAKESFLNYQEVKSFKGPLSYQQAQLTAFRHRLLSKSFDMLTPTPDTMLHGNTPLYNQLVFEDMNTIADALTSFDEMLGSTRDIPPDLFNDLNKMVNEMTTANSGEIRSNLNELSSRTLTDEVEKIRQELKSILVGDLDSHVSLSSLDYEMKSLSQELDNSSLNRLDQEIKDNLNQSDQDINHSLSQLNNEIKEAVKDFDQQLANIDLSQPMALDEVNKVLEEIGDLGLSGIGSSASKVNQSLIDVVLDAPYDMNEGVQEVIASYSESMTEVENNLPPLLFPVVMPVPLAYDDGDGNSMIIPAGSYISQNRKTGAYTILSSGLILNSGDTSVVSGQSTIKLGNGLDQLQMNQLSVTNSDSQFDLYGFTAQIDRTNGQSLLRADQATMDLSDGKVDLTNGNLVTNSDGSVQLSAESFLYDKEGTLVSFDDFNLGQTLSEESSTLGGSASSINLTSEETSLNAESLSFFMNQQEDGTHTGNITVENLNYVSEMGALNAESATVDILSNPDGSASTVISTTDPRWVSENEKLTVDGLSTVTIQQNAEGVLTQVHFQAGDIHFENQSGNLDAIDGSITLDYNDDGSLSSITSDSGEINYSGEFGNFNAQGNHLGITYGKDGFIETIDASTSNISLTTEKGEIIQISNGSVSIERDSKGFIKSISGQADNLQFQGINGESLNASGTNIQINGNENGIESLNVEVGTLNFSGQNGESINLTNGNLNLERDAEEGFIKQISGNVQDLDFTGVNGEQVKASGLNLELHGTENGLESLSISAGELNYSGVNGENAELFNGSISIERDSEDGYLKNLSGSAEKLIFSNADGESVKASGLNLEITGGESGFETFNAQAGSLEYLSNKGEQLNVENGMLSIERDAEGDFIKSLSGSAESLNWLSPDGESIKASGLSLEITGGESGFETFNAQAGSLEYLSNKGEQLNVENGILSIERDAEGDFIKSLSGSAESLNWLSPDGESVNASGTHINILGNEDGLESLNVEIGTLDYQSKLDETLFLENGSLSIERDSSEGYLKSLTGNVEHLKWENTKGEILNASGLNIEIKGNSEGLETANVEVGILNYTDVKGQQFDVENGSLSYSDLNGQLTLTALAQEVNWQGSDGAFASGSNLIFSYSQNETLTSLTGSIDSFSYGDESNVFNVENGQVNAEFNTEDGQLLNFNLSGENVSYSSLSNKGKAIQIDFNAIESNLETLPDGSQQLHFNGEEGNLVIDGHKISLESIENLDILVNPEGQITQLDLNMPGSTTFDDSKGDVSAILKDLNANYAQEGNTFSISFGELILDLKKEGYDVNITDGELVVSDELVSFAVGSASLKEKLSDELNIQVDELQVLIDKNDAGGLSEVDIQLAELEGKIKGYNIFVTSETGDKLRLNVKFSEDGSMLKEAFLQIPEGGEVKVVNDDLTATLGPSLYSFSQDGNGLYTFKANDVNINAVTKDATVSVQGGNAEVRLDTENGDLIIHDITGIQADVSVGDENINLNIEEMDGFLLRLTGISGLAEGAMVHLKPVDGSSKLTASISTNYGGIPIKVEFDNLNELKMLGTIQENEVRVMAADPTGQGYIEMNMGPLKLHGSAIEMVARYHQYTDEKLLYAISNSISSANHVQVTKNLSVNPDGIIHLSTSNSGPYADLTIMIPQNQQYHQFPSEAQRNNVAAGAVVGVGWRGHSDSGTAYTGKVYTGIVPASHVSIDRPQGGASIGGVPLPKHMRIPTTAIAGVGFSRHSYKSKIDATVGAFVNPVGLAPDDLPIKEEIVYGGFAGVYYRKDDYMVGLDGTIGVKKNKELSPAVRVTYGVKFE